MVSVSFCQGRFTNSKITQMKQTNSNEAKNASDNAEMMVHVDESLNFHTSRNSYVNLSQDSCDKIEKANWACISSENDASSTVVNKFRTKQAKASLIYKLLYSVC